MKVREISKAEIESIRDAGWVDAARRIYVKGGQAFVPVKDGYRFDSELPERRPYNGRGFHMIGDIAVVHGDRPSCEQVAGIVSWQRPRGVMWIRGYRGVMRVPDTEVLYGSAGEVSHRESGITFILDPRQVMFAQGNRIERERMAGITGPDERVADMFAGIGYFALPMATSGARVHAMEINPAAYRYLAMNAAQNRVEHLVCHECGDCKTLLSGEYDRIVMGHFNSMAFLPAALDHAHPGSEIHVHTIGMHKNEIREICESAGFRAICTSRIVKKYGPGNGHYVQDVLLV